MSKNTLSNTSMKMVPLSPLDHSFSDQTTQGILLPALYGEKPVLSGKGLICP